MSNTAEPKPNVGHFDREDTLIDNTENSDVAEQPEAKSGLRARFGSKLTKTGAKDGDLGGRWLSTYTGPRTELTDDLNTKIRNRIDAYLLPLIFLIYFSGYCSLSTSRDDADITQINNRTNLVWVSDSP